MVGLLRHIVQEGVNVNSQVQQGAQHWYNLWDSKQLSSRKRNTYKRMLNRWGRDSNLQIIHQVPLLLTRPNFDLHMDK